MTRGPDDELDALHGDDEEDDDDLEDSDDEAGIALAQALLEVFDDVGEGMSLFDAQHGVITFAVMATQMLVVNLAEDLEGSSATVPKALEEWLVDAAHSFMDGVSSETLLRQIAAGMERPYPPLRLSRQFRRRLAGR